MSFDVLVALLCVRMVLVHWVH